MPPNLRSAVAQLSRRRGSVGSRRNFRSTLKSNESTDAERRVAGLTMAKKIEYFGSYIVYGYSAFLCWEIIELLEYRRTVQKFLDERRGKVTNMNPLVMVRWLLYD